MEILFLSHSLRRGKMAAITPEKKKRVPMKPLTREQKIRWCWAVCLVLLWGFAIFLFIRTHGDLSMQDLLRYQPESRPLAALAMCGLFLLKSVDFVLYSGLLYAMDGVMFPLPAAFGMDADDLHAVFVHPVHPVVQNIVGIDKKFGLHGKSLRNLSCRGLAQAEA